VELLDCFNDQLCWRKIIELAASFFNTASVFNTATVFNANTVFYSQPIC
jgi:hypothetical protein